MLLLIQDFTSHIDHLFNITIGVAFKCDDHSGWTPHWDFAPYCTAAYTEFVAKGDRYLKIPAPRLSTSRFIECTFAKLSSPEAALVHLNNLRYTRSIPKWHSEASDRSETRMQVISYRNSITYVYDSERSECINQRIIRIETTHPNSSRTWSEVKKKYSGRTQA